MGWSCSQAASKVMDRMSQACINNCGSGNTWKENDVEYFFETSRREYSDGAITGVIYKTVSKDGVDYSHKVGSLRINGDGTVTRACKFLKDAAKSKTTSELYDEHLMNKIKEDRAKLEAEFAKGHKFVVL